MRWHALFRDRQPFPWQTLSSAGQGPVNARLLWEAGLVSYGYGTDTQWPPKETLADELRALRLVFSPQDVVKIITKNAADATLHGAEIGTLEPGKFADIVIVDGDPLSDSSALLQSSRRSRAGRSCSRRRSAGRSESDRDVRLRLTTRNRLGTSRSFPVLATEPGGLPDAVRQVDARTVALRDAAAWTSLPVVNHFAPWRAESTEIAGICDATLCGWKPYLQGSRARLARCAAALHSIAASTENKNRDSERRAPMTTLVRPLAALILATTSMAAYAAPSVYPTGTTLYDPARTWSGYTVLSVLRTQAAIVIDMNGNVVKRWDGYNDSAGGPARVLPGGTIIAAAGARPPHQESLELVERDFDGNVIWRFDHNEQIETRDGKTIWALRQHHDWQREDFPAGYYSPEDHAPRARAPRP